ncbi:hypothetical protein SERLA73DRAFT_190344 [Serpula lacrymans var. lacrymans S7.3]|uniref:NmrA-like domain-containing protein n=2 Tax=Serpula lacrymans var. lacrymans TaxID=341189 RepID=F8QFI8_SERL3|nr:uncharacterized protein SERLADRAFT_479382 [Serpula lacrymans var. lacrymans S7.9]EGN92972.1 hypothetical protein SERLA73DRAFT_190344 [Serpula lacrymans var. lacrymans S7.3]EGO19686.1 hypothetical protein SERLADRAFT_479382 [Serpula lacrymans var. lacrymans S7.9]
MAERIVAVFGATGTQGSSVMDALLADGTFKPRAITRNPLSDAAQALKNRGAEVVQANLLDADSVKRAISGCECVFGVTDYGDAAARAQGVNTEEKIGKSLVDSAKEVGVRFFVWSSLPNLTKVTGGKYCHAYHFDNKANVEDYLKESGLPNATLRTGFFAENTWKTHCLRKSDSGFELTMPLQSESTPLQFTWIGHDLGPSVLILLKNYQSRQDEILGQTFHLISENVTFGNFAQALENAFGVPVKFKTAPKTGLLEIDDMLEVIAGMGMYGDVEIPDSRLLKLGLKFGTPQEFAESVKSRFL